MRWLCDARLHLAGVFVLFVAVVARYDPESGAPSLLPFETTAASPIVHDHKNCNVCKRWCPPEVVAASDRMLVKVGALVEH